MGVGPSAAQCGSRRREGLREVGRGARTGRVSFACGLNCPIAQLPNCAGARSQSGRKVKMGWWDGMLVRECGEPGKGRGGGSRSRQGWGGAVLASPIVRSPPRGLTLGPVHCAVVMFDGRVTSVRLGLDSARPSTNNLHGKLRAGFSRCRIQTATSTSNTRRFARGRSVSGFPPNSSHRSRHRPGRRDMCIFGGLEPVLQ